jgi:hypothetical protein
MSTGVLAYGLLRTARRRRFFSIFRRDVYCSMESLIISTAYFPVLFPAILAKPNIGIPVEFTLWLRKGIWCVGIVTAGSLCIEPHWFLRWWSQTGGYQGFILLFTLPGPLLLCAILRIKKKSAQLLLLSSRMPQRLFYDPLIL